MFVFLKCVLISSLLVALNLPPLKRFRSKNSFNALVTNAPHEFKCPMCFVESI